VELEKLVYICHKYGNDCENFENITVLLQNLTREHPEICFLSPVHALSYLNYDATNPDGMNKCLFLLDMCDEMWTFGENSMSPGCLAEKQYCKEHRIPIVDWQVV